VELSQSINKSNTDNYEYVSTVFSSSRDLVTMDHRLHIPNIGCSQCSMIQGNSVSSASKSFSFEIPGLK